MKEKFEIIDNFLPQEVFSHLQSFMLGSDISWYMNKGTTWNPDRQIDDYHKKINNTIDKDFAKKRSEIEGVKFTHTFYRPIEGITSDHFNLLRPLLHAADANHVIAIKANMQLSTPEIVEHCYHTDTFVNCTTMVYHLNTCNGYTHFKSGEKVESVANRAVIFNSRIPHGGSTCTNDINRVVLNINIHKEE
tara:strand:- start:113 stop:685 length:573 start_codon:yes stop_codon:yes gene_type:complete